MSWNRLLWGIEFHGGMPSDEPILIGTSWMNPIIPERYIGEPSRPILFRTRSLARYWCKEKMATYSNSSVIYKKLKFRPVRVIECVIKVKS